MTHIRPPRKESNIDSNDERKMTIKPDGTAKQWCPPRYNSKVHGIICGKREIKLQAMVRPYICKMLMLKTKPTRSPS